MLCGASTSPRCNWRATCSARPSDASEREEHSTSYCFWFVRCLCTLFSTPQAAAARRQFYRRALDAYEAADALCPRQATLRSQIPKTTGLMRKFGPRPGEGPKGADDDEDDGEEEGEDDGEAEG